jgi:flap endonuclease-1
MGIKNLTSFLLEHCPEAITQAELNKLYGQKVAIDTSIFLYRFKYKGNKLISKFFEQINRLRLNNITPIYIFDGVPPEEKKSVIISRKLKLEDKWNKIDILNKELETSTDSEKIKAINNDITNLQNKLIYVSKDDVYQVKYLFDLLNIKYIVAEGEADLLCSKLCSNGIVDFVISEDMDLLTSGTKILVRDFNIYNNKITIYNLQTILEKLELTYEKWVELCIMFGCDYLKRINGIGPKKSYKFIKKNDTIEQIIEYFKTSNINVDANYITNFNNAKNIFMNYSIDYIPNTSQLVCIDKLFDNQLTNINTFITKYTTLSQKQISNRINNIYKNIL